MEQVTDLARRLRERWSESSLAGAPVTAGEVAKLELRFGRLPVEYQILLQVAGRQVSEDANGFRFWDPDELKLAHVISEPRYQGFGNALIIADYLHESWWYGLWLDGASAGRVSLLLGTTKADDPRLPIALTEFIENYLTDPDELFPTLWKAPLVGSMTNGC